jgi:hypothetical protein
MCVGKGLDSWRAWIELLAQVINLILEILKALGGAGLTT